MANLNSHRTSAKFGTLPVFMTTISTILGNINLISDDKKKEIK